VSGTQPCFVDKAKFATGVAYNDDKPIEKHTITINFLSKSKAFPRRLVLIDEIKRNIVALKTYFFVNQGHGIRLTVSIKDIS
jgi:hypothetical protein